MMKKLIKLTALLLCMAMLMSTFAGCGFLFDGGDNDEPVDVFNPPYLENYYVNKHTPVAKQGGMEIYKYKNKNSETFTLGGNDYHGGIEFWSNTGPLEYADIEFPLDGQYNNFSFVLCGNGTEKAVEKIEDGKEIYYSYVYALDGAYPTLIGTAREMKVGIQIIIDGKVTEEFILSSYDVAKRYTYDVSGAQTFEVKVVTGDTGFNMYMMEITAWEGEAHETGYVPEPAGNTPVKLIRDLKPYLIPITSSVEYYPNYASDERNYINMNAVKFEDAIVTQISMELVGETERCVFFDLEGKYNYLTFTAGAADRTTSYDEGSAWLTVYADGKIIFEEVMSTHDLYKQFTVDVTGCRQLKFAWLIEEGNENFGNAAGGIYGIGDAYVSTTREALNTIAYSSREYPQEPVKMISELGVFGVLSNVEGEAVFDGSTQFKTFSMGGVKYNEGIMLYSMNTMLMTKPATASFNLGGNYTAISFVVGHISNSNVYENDQIEIYADGELIKTIDVKCTMLPQEYIVDVTGCKHLEFVSGKQTNTLMERPAFGIANLVAYPDGFVETDLFPERQPEDFGKTCDLIDTFGFYDVYNSHIGQESGAVGVQDGYYDGTTNKNTFTVGDKTYNKGILLKTNIHMELDMAGVAGATVLGSMLGGWGLCVLALADSGEAHESAFAMANIKNSGYTSVTFTVAMQEDCSGIITQDETTLMIGADDKCVWETTLYKGMEPTTFTVELGEDCDRLMFWLDCSLEDDGSHVYAIYDITLNK